MFTRTKKLGVVIAVATACGVAFTLWWVARPKSPLRILTSNVSGVETIPISAFTEKPTFDFTLPIIGRVVFPRHETTTYFASFNTKTMSGVIRQVNPRPMAGSSAEVGIYWDFGPLKRYFPLTTNDGSKFLDEPCPLVFGRQPQVGSIITGVSLSSLRPIRVLLPSNGIDEPKREAHRFDYGGVKLDIEPEPWISPIFALIYRIQVHGPKGLYRLRLNLKPKAGTEGTSASYDIYTEPGKQSFLELDTWPTESEVTSTLTQLAGKPSDLVVEYVIKSGTSIAAGTAGPPWYRLRAADGTTYEADWEMDSFGTYTLRKATPGLAGVKVGTKWMMWNYPEMDCFGSGAAIKKPFFSDGGHILTTKPKGAHVPAVIYKEGSTWTSHFPLSLPGYKKYCEM